jgi:hypothetical protein
MRINHASPLAEALDPCGSTETVSPAVNIPSPGPQDIDLLATEAEALEAAGVPWAYRDALRKSLPAVTEDGAPCPGGFGVGV